MSRVPNPEDGRSLLIVPNHQATAEPIALLQDIQQKYNTTTAEFSDENLDVIATYLERIERLSGEMTATLYHDVRPFFAAS